ncbi:DMT family transporter [Pararhizobium haloflavum]|uniref:DMT family transporter n=1 Tax=Pararhizobium haloflavum TaxID=2037914 RepID=UPI001FE1C778|nr:DMT family transporter [Pararhizobium haloflavum]
MTGVRVPPGISRTMGPLEWGMIGLLSVLWGGSFFFVGVAVKELSTLTIVLCRVGLAAAALWIWVALSRRPLPKRVSVWMAFVGMGVLNNVVPFTLMVWGQQTIASGLASILNATTPLFTVVVAGLFLADETWSWRKMAGVLVGLAGVAVMIGLEVLSGLSHAVAAQCAVLAGALSYALAGVFGRRFARWGVDPVITAAGQVTASTLILAPVALMSLAGAKLALPSGAVVAALLGLSLLSTAAAYVLYFTVLARAGATNLLLVTFLIPVSAILLGVIFLEERLEWAHAGGMMLIGLGLILIDGRLIARFRQKRAIRV